MRRKKIIKGLGITMAIIMAVGLLACGNGERSGTESESIRTAESFLPGEPEKKNDVSPTLSEEKQEEVSETGPEEEDPDAEMIAQEPLSSGAISIGGETIRMGDTYSQIQDGKWTLNPADFERFQTYSLKPRTTAGEGMTLFSDEYGREFSNFHVVISLVNRSDQSIPYLDGAIDYLSLPSLTRQKNVPLITLPGGLTLESSEEQFKEIYGDPSSEYEDESKGYRSLSFKEGDIKMKVSWLNGNINEITITQ